jgi:polyhydroxybutyrate depolymerase
MSNGAQLSHRLACERSWRIASVAPVAGTDNTLACAPTRPVPVMHIHGTDDQNQPYAGGIGCGVSGVASTSVPDTITAWQDRNQCPGPAQPRLIAGDGTCETYGRCRNEAEVVLCAIAGGGHTWPGGEPPVISGIGSCGFGGQSTTFDASARSLDFFALHPLP